MSGVGPLIAASPTRHNDPNMATIQPIEISQFAQNPALWPNIESMEQHAIAPHTAHPHRMQHHQFPQMVNVPNGYLSFSELFLFHM